MTAYAPIGASGYQGKSEEFKKMNAFEEPVITGLAEKYSKTPAQIILNWHLHRNVIVIPKTTKVSRLSENINVFDFKMTEEEYQQINELNKDARFFDPVY